MTTEYRQMQADDEDSILDLWAEVWSAPGAATKHRRQQFHCDPNYLEHTYLAVASDGTLLSTVHYWSNNVRSADGRSRRVGCVSHVVTRASARRQGHALRLMEMLLEIMQRDGCEWTMLYSSEMGKSLYQCVGYRPYQLPYIRGLLSLERPVASGHYSVNTFEPSGSAGDWSKIAEIYAAYNLARPLTLVRDPAYWECRVGLRYARLLSGHTTVTYIAASDGALRGYAIVCYSSRDVAQERFGLDQIFTVGEIGVLPGHEGAIPALLSAAVGGTEEGPIGGRLMLPREEPAASVAQVIFGDTLELFDDQDIMARPLASNISEADLDILFSNPRAVFWLADGF